MSELLPLLPPGGCIILHPTKTRLSLLADIANSLVLTDITTDSDVILLFPYAPTEWQTRERVTARVRELEKAGWVEQDEAGVNWQPTAYGRQLLLREASS
jgi:hypothetical protein